MKIGILFLKFRKIPTNDLQISSVKKRKMCEKIKFSRSRIADLVLLIACTLKFKLKYSVALAYLRIVKNDNFTLNYSKPSLKRSNLKSFNLKAINLHKF